VSHPLEDTAPAYCLPVAAVAAGGLADALLSRLFPGAFGPWALPPLSFVALAAIVCAVDEATGCLHCLGAGRGPCDRSRRPGGLPWRG
jgi:hypothetical protein